MSRLEGLLLTVAGSTALADALATAVSSESLRLPALPAAHRSRHRGVLSLSSIKMLNEYERAVVFRLGKLLPQPKGPGVILVFAPIDRMVRVSLRTIVMDVPPQDVITRDNVSVKVNAVVYFRVMDPRRAIVEVESYHYATSQLAQTTLRSVLGQVELDDLLSERESSNLQLQQILDQRTDPWGIKVSSVEVKHVDLPPDMQRAMARQAEAEREKRAKIIHAEGELEASEKLAQAAGVIATEPDVDHPSLSADTHGDRVGKELDDHLSASNRAHSSVLEQEISR